MANGQVMVAFLEQSMCSSPTTPCLTPQHLPTPQSTLAKVCTLKVLGKGNCIPQERIKEIHGVHSFLTEEASVNI